MGSWLSSSSRLNLSDLGGSLGGDSSVGDSGGRLSVGTVLGLSCLSGLLDGGVDSVSVTLGVGG